MSELNLQQARHNMVQQQIRPWDVLDSRVLGLLEEMPREDFVPDAYRKLAYTDIDIPLGHGEVMMPPRLEARMLQALNVQPQETALEIGTGSGYVTALLAKLARHVYSVEVHPEFTAAAAPKLAAYGILNVTLETGDASRGWSNYGQMDVIAITGSFPSLPEVFEHTLKPGGRLFVVVGDAPAMEAMLITRLSADEFRREKLFETVLPPLRNAPQPDRFVL
ncbi:MAG: methyltransferase domain-containing protein [Gammaproteobacteria bacterium]|nr:methyltransferase domain-containing protein [Gammaproteobacteria bacterium]